VGEAGKTYEFLAVATDLAGNREAAAISNAVLPDDGARQAILDQLGVNATLEQSASTPQATQDRSYVENSLFDQALNALPGHVATAQPGDLQSVVAPFTLRGFADGFAAGVADQGAQAMVELADGRILVSAGANRNAVYVYDAKGGHGVTPLFELNAPIQDMAVDALGQLWVLTGSELMLVISITDCP